MRTIMSSHGRFVRVPTDLLEALLKERLSGTQFAILFWIIRQTFGWNRPTTPFSWYRVATDLVMDRGGVFRAGRALLRLGIVHVKSGEIGIRGSDTVNLGSAARPTVASDDRNPRKPMTGVIASDDGRQLQRCQQSSFYRRAKDNIKDRIKTKRQAHRITGAKMEARARSRKYEQLSQG